MCAFGTERVRERKIERESERERVRERESVCTSHFFLSLILEEEKFEKHAGGVISPVLFASQHH